VSFSCNDVLELDLLVDPNNPTPETADLESLYNSVQIEFSQFLEAPQFFTMQLSRQRAMTAGAIYAQAFSPNNFDNTWNQAYRDFIPDADAVIALAEPNGQFIHSSSAKIMKAYALMALVDMFGPVPNLDPAERGIDNLSPPALAGDVVYGQAEDLLNEAIAELGSNTAAAPAANIMFDDAAGWITAANTLLLRSAVNRRDMGAFNAIISAGDFIDNSGEDWQFEYGPNRANPDSRHPFYVNSWEAGDGQYQSNWLMWAMSVEKGLIDPRIRGYFYRQVEAVPLDNLNRFDCIFSVLPDEEATPTWYLNCDEDMPYCVGSIEQGYYGRDHGNGNGIPPDGDIRAVYGVYPGGGKYDNNSFRGTQNLGTDGALGAGIHPIMPSFYVDFMRAEMAAVSGDTDAARGFLLTGVQASIDKVLNFIMNRDPGSVTEVVATDINGNQLFGSDFLPTLDDVDAYLAAVADLYDNSSDPMDVIAKEFLIATYGNGLEGFNMIRRTGRPGNLQPAIQGPGVAGTLIRSALYPAVNVNLNQTATQKDQQQQVFWDTQSADLGPCFN